jgi:hypothetical protein
MAAGGAAGERKGSWMGLKRRARKLIAKLVVLGAISAATKYFSDFKQGGARRKKIMNLIGK